MSGGAEQLDAMIATLRGLGVGFAAKAAAEAAPLLEAAAKASAAAGTTPSGEAWAPRKKDGGRAMKNAANAVSAKSSGDIVTVTVKGPEAIHNDSKAYPRRIIPSGGGTLPASYAAALTKGAQRAFAKATAQ